MRACAFVWVYVCLCVWDKKWIGVLEIVIRIGVHYRKNYTVELIRFQG